MRNKETGEFELVVGDKQLLSGFFIGVVLLAVIFALGYIMGRGTAKSAPDVAAVTPANAATETRPQPSAPVVPASPEPAATTPAQTDTQTTPAEGPPQPTTVPARAESSPAPPPAAASSEPGNASYWQVTAASKNSADAVSQTLLSKGFPASTRPGPNNLTVVWVGPYTDKASLQKAKKLLEDAGFNPIKKSQ